MEIKPFKAIAAIAFCLLISLSCSASKKKPVGHLLPIADAKSLKKGMGYLLVDLDINGVAPSIEIASIRSNGNSIYLYPEPSVVKLSKRKQLDFSGAKTGFYVYPLPAGLYQITRINAPYFNLPFRLSTKNRRDWRFSIQKDAFNYIGKFHIDKQRSTSNVSIRLFNRIATDLDSLSKAVSSLVNPLPLISAAGVRDDFYAELSKPIDSNKTELPIISKVSGSDQRSKEQTNNGE